MDYRRTIDLGGSDWDFGCVPSRDQQASDSAEARRPRDDSLTRLDTGDIHAVREWLPATVPGDVHADLLAAGRIPDPFVDLANQQSQWVDERDWWYRKRFCHTLANDERAFLIFYGIDYIAAVYLDGQLLGYHEGMFSRQVYEVTRLLQSPIESHQLAVRLLGPSHFSPRQLNLLEKLWEAFTAWLPRGEGAFPERLGFLKSQMGYGWDFAPRLRTVGIWDDVELAVVRSVWIRDVHAQTIIEEERATLSLNIDLDAAQSVSAGVHVDLRERATGWLAATRTFDSMLPAGEQRISTVLSVTQPKLWQPWDRGAPHLYDLTVSVTRVQNESEATLDTYCQPLGFRKIELARSPEGPATAEPWIFQVNGHREFIRGANWVPLDAMPGRLHRTDYETILDQARAAGVNLLRVWGGGLREKTAFYDLCDEKGILVWQDFPFACAFLGHFRQDTDYLDLIRRECSDIVRQLRHHPSLALWCGGNEFSAWRNRRLVHVLRAVVAEEDGTRPFKPVSPTRGESHNWRVWHGKAAISHYQREKSAMLSEFGLQATPDVDSLRRFISADRLWPPGDEWTYHNAALEKLFRYAQPLLPPEIDSLETLLESKAPHFLEAFVAATQQAQAHGLQVAIEHVRRRKGRTGGVLFWQLDEPWPSICWSIIDYYGRPKSAYHKVACVYNPVLLSALYPLTRCQPGDQIEIELWGINDLAEPVEHALAEVVLDGAVIFQCEASLPPDSSAPIGRISYLPEQPPRRLELRLTARTGEVICINEYDLAYTQSTDVIWQDYVIARLVELLIKW